MSTAATAELPEPTSAKRAAKYEFQGREVTMPVVVRDASVGMATYAVPRMAAQRLIPGDAFEVAEVWPGKALFGLGAIDYRDNDLGDYNEVSMLFFVRRRGEVTGLPYAGSIVDMVRGRLATYIYRLPVDQSFTCDAGRGIWGFPKTVDEIDIEYRADSVRSRLKVDGEEVFTLNLARGGRRNLPDADQTSYTYIDGAPHRTQARQRARGVGFQPVSGAELALGRHPIADELRSMGLPKRPLMTMWMEHMHATFEAPTKL
jgi:hypothetical protein